MPTPNILTIMLDDMPAWMFFGRDENNAPFMPFLMSKRLQARQFENVYLGEPVCCPSRVSFLTGMYPRTHGITANTAPSGGYDAFIASSLDHKGWPILMKGDSYTGLIGKFLNGYKHSSVPMKPEGWSFSYFLAQGNATPFNWKARRNDEPDLIVWSGTTDAVYQTNVLADEVAAAMQRAKNQDRPFALTFSPFAPHLPATPAKEFEGLYASEPFQPNQKPSFNEADVSDKPAYIQALPLLTLTDIQSMRADWRHMLESLRSVDKALETLWDKIDQLGELQNTYIFVCVDNGYQYGEHRTFKKQTPYLESIRSKMYVWGPDVVPDRDYRIVTLSDLAPTFLEIVGKPVPTYMDGRSILPHMRNASGAFSRNSFLVQGYPLGGPVGGGRQFLTLVTENWHYTKYDVDREYYDVVNDPYQLSNGYAALPQSFVDAAEAKISALLAAVGAAQCAPIEDAPL